VVQFPQLEFCPKVPLAKEQADCTRDRSNIKPNLEYAVILSAAFNTDGTINVWDTAVENYDAAITNLAQVMHAAIRLDLGHVLPNNVLVNPAMINGTIAAGTSLEGSYLYTDLNADGSDLFTYPVFSLDETTIDVQFLCKLKSAKSWPEIMINTLVATVSMFGTGWGIAMLAAAYFAKKTPTGEFVLPGSLQETDSNSRSECL
jgi:hypothetical protein